MKKSASLSLILLGTASTLVVTGCVVHEHVSYVGPGPATAVVAQEPVGAEVVVTEAPPPPVTEVVTLAPAPGFVWIGGCWVWRGHWVWERGHWARPPHRGAVWVPHRYMYRNGVHVFVRGGWRW
jgi:hypothetical protein